jgi:hypothetical protein
LGRESGSGTLRTLAGISYVSCKLVRPSDICVSVWELTGALSGMKRSPKHSTSRDAIAPIQTDAGDLKLGGEYKCYKEAEQERDIIPGY